MNRASAQAPAAQSKTDPKINDAFKKPDVKAYIKRFESEDREPYARRHEIVAALELKPGMVVADIGAGTGLFTRLMAEKVGPTGKVYAVDIAPEFLAHIAADAKKNGRKQVVTVRGNQETTNLPKDSLDLVFLSDVYHHLERPQQILASLRESLKPGGKLVLIEFDRVEGRSYRVRLETRACRPGRVHQGDRGGRVQANEVSPRRRCSRKTSSRRSNELDPTKESTICGPASVSVLQNARGAEQRREGVVFHHATRNRLESIPLGVRYNRRLQPAVAAGWWRS